jgi:hypothetical protein
VQSSFLLRVAGAGRLRQGLESRRPRSCSFVAIIDHMILIVIAVVIIGFAIALYFTLE